MGQFKDDSEFNPSWWRQRLRRSCKAIQRHVAGFTVSIFLSFLLFPIGSELSADDLPNVTQNRLKNIVGYYRTGRSLEVIEEGGRLLQQLNEKDLDKVNRFLKTQMLDTLQSMLVDARIDLDRPNVTARIPAPTNKEALYLAWEIRDRVDRIENEFLAHP